ncbi:MAG: Tim44 domain-containing protein [Alphaproteobacteria bacterium]|nr:Tim44 domain-containing protein [Alphaproteobacteria bacterium]
MGDGFQFIDIILLAMIAGFIVLRLRNVLGRRTGFEQRRPPATPGAPVEPAEDNVLPLPDRRKLEQAQKMLSSGPAADGLSRIKQADADFDPVDFIAGAKAAYEMIVGAFAHGDTAALKPLLSPDVFQSFAGAIAERNAADQTLTSTIIAIKSADIVEADLKGRVAEVTVKFVSDLINATHDATGKLISGSTTVPEEVTDIWTFARDLRSSDPNWTLVATSAPA